MKESSGEGEIICEFADFGVLKEERLLETGTSTTHYTVTHPGAVVVLPLRPDGSIVFVNQYRHSVRDTLLELPAGKLEQGEDPLLCAKRELSEEAGLGADKWIYLGKVYPAPGICNEIQYIYAAEALFDCPGEQDEDEEIVVKELSEAEFVQYLQSERIYDSKSIAALSLYNIKVRKT